MHESPAAGPDVHNERVVSAGEETVWCVRRDAEEGLCILLVAALILEQPHLNNVGRILGKVVLLQHVGCPFDCVRGSALYCALGFVADNDEGGLDYDGEGLCADLGAHLPDVLRIVGWGKAGCWGRRLDCARSEANSDDGRWSGRSAKGPELHKGISLDLAVGAFGIARLVVDYFIGSGPITKDESKVLRCAGFLVIARTNY